MLHFDLRNGEVIPCATSLLDDEKFSANPAAVAQNDTIANTSKLQPSIPEMGNYWGNAESLGKALADEGFINIDTGENTRTMRFGSKTKRVLLLRKDMVEKVMGL